MEKKFTKGRGQFVLWFRISNTSWVLGFNQFDNKRSGPFDRYTIQLPDEESLSVFARGRWEDILMGVHTYKTRVPVYHPPTAIWIWRKTRAVKKWRGENCQSLRWHSIMRACSPWLKPNYASVKLKYPETQSSPENLKAAVSWMPWHGTDNRFVRW